MQPFHLAHASLLNCNIFRHHVLLVSHSSLAPPFSILLENSELVLLEVVAGRVLLLRVVLGDVVAILVGVRTSRTVALAYFNIQNMLINRGSIGLALRTLWLRSRNRGFCS